MCVFKKTMDVSQINVLFLMNDVCKMYQNVYQTLIPVPMTNSFNNFLQNQRNKNELIQENFSFQCRYVQQDYKNNSDFLYGNVVSALPENEDESFLFTFWKFTLLHQISKSDFENLNNLYKTGFIQTYTTYSLVGISDEDTKEADPTESPLQKGLKLEKHLQKNTVSVLIEQLDTFSPKTITTNYNYGLSVLSSLAHIHEQFDFDKRFHSTLTSTDITFEGVNQAIYLMCLSLQSKYSFFLKLPRQIVNFPFLEPNLKTYRIPIFSTEVKQLYGPLYNLNTCFINTALVGLLLFPSKSILHILYNIDIPKAHVLDKNVKFCQRKALDKTNIEDVAAYSFNDQNNKINFVLALRELYEALQIRNYDEIQNARDKVYAKTIECSSFTSNPIIGVNEMGESEAVYEYFNVLFNLSGYNKMYKVFAYYNDINADESKADCTTASPRPDPISLFYPLNNIDTDEIADKSKIFMLRDLLGLKQVMKGSVYACGDSYYPKRVEENFFDFRHNTIVFTLTRNKLPGSKNPDELFEVKVQPDQELELTANKNGMLIPYKLYLRAIICFYRYAAHYVCLLCNPSNKVWYLYDTTEINEYAFTYDDMLTTEKEIISVSGASRVVQNFAMCHSTSFIYSSDADVSVEKKDNEEHF